MARTGFFHHVGSFLLLVGAVLLIVTSISAPTVKNISMLRVEVDGGQNDARNPVITFGTFGWCTQNTNLASGDDFCSPARVGYDPAQIVVEVMSESDGVDFEDYASDSARALTHVMVLHPVAAGLTFIAFLLALGAGIVGSLLSALVALLAFLVVLVALVCDFVAFAIIRHAVHDADDRLQDSNNANGRELRAMYGSGSWTLLAAAVVIFIGMLVVLFTCCSARMHRRREARGLPATTAREPKDDWGTTPGAGRRRWRF